MTTDCQPKRAVELLATGRFAEALEMIVRMPVLALVDLDALYEAWANDGQLAPSGAGWRTWLIQGGRGFGKTRAGAEWVHDWPAHDAVGSRWSGRRSTRRGGLWSKGRAGSWSRRARTA